MQRSPGLTPEQLQQVLEAERKENALLDAQEQAARQKAEAEKMAARKEKAKRKEATPVAAPAPVAVSPIPTTVPESVPPALSGPKEQQLNQLLQLYKADKISPYEYHQERAKILAE
ncbi:MAG TPA: hypothetical protein VFB72_04440, partial [Verrucomicrobiae bacterium]|nr:hypothetical protein [Verrucomicrobiae bacterium]